MKVYIINPVGRHIRTLILLHGMNQSITDILTKISKRGTKLVIPIANKKTINWPDNIEKNCVSWYNYFSRYDNLYKHDIIDTNQFEKITESIIALIIQESKLIDPSKISLAGISQGGTVCINAALKLNFSIKNVICIDTIFLDIYYQHCDSAKQTFKVLYSNNDKVYNPEFQIKCYNILKTFSHRLIMSRHAFGHCENTVVIADFISKNC